MIKSQTGYDVPSDAGEITKPGVYIRLYHGRTHPGEDLDDWGKDGPIIGPLEAVHCTYGTNLRLSFVSDEDRARYFEWGGIEQDLRHEEDLVAYAGMYYGDWAVFCEIPVPAIVQWAKS